MNKQNKIPEDIECVSLGSGCPNGCEYCHEPKEVKFDGVTFTQQKVKINDMNILAYPEPYKLLHRIGETKRYFELVCGIDFRRLDIPTACLLRKYRFGRFNKKGKWSRYIRFAWDYGLDMQYKMRDTFMKLTDVGFKPHQIGVFVLVNWKISFEDCFKKLDTFKYWGCQIDDCCWDGGYPEDRKDFVTNERFKESHWSYDQIIIFRKFCRKHNQLVVRNGLDPELKVSKEQ